MKQIKLNLFQGTHGGRRPGSGRKRLKSVGVSHRTRAVVSAKTPLHINFKYRSNIRNKQTLKLLKKAIRNARSHGVRVLHYSFQANHIHLILESPNNKILTKAMRSLTITIAKGLGLGRIQLERYHLHVLKTVRETTHAIRYVLFNQQKHEKGRYSKINEYSSLLSMENALVLIKNFAQTRRLSLILEKPGVFDLDQGRSFMFKRGITELAT
jgi:REP element-mobilizing transposase RayT